MIVLACLMIVVFLTQLADSGLREPRLVFRNSGFDTIEHVTVVTPTQTVNLGRLAEGLTLTLPIKPKAGDHYTILGHSVPGDELIRLLDIARRERRDAFVGVDEHGCLTLEGWESHFDR
jgi:hypothetical protein